MQSDASLSWLALALTPGLASRLSARVLRRFDSPEGVFRATLRDLESCHLPAQVSQAIVKKESFKRAEKELPGIKKIAGCSLLNWTEPEYPQTLLQIYDPPVLLYVRGDPQILNLPSLSIVGTRRPTFYGTPMAQRLGRDLAARGLVIVSGMARGIDAIGHQGAMDAHGRAIGALGTGIDVCYPKENKKLYEKVLERGAIISEFSLRMHFCAGKFSGAKSHRCRHATRGGGGRRAVQRVADHRAPGHGVRQRSIRRAGERYAAREFRAEPTHQAGREARHLRRGGDRRAAHAHPCRPPAGRAAKSIGRRHTEWLGKKALRAAQRRGAGAH